MNSAPGPVDESVAPLIDGVVSESSGGDAVEVINPSNGRRCLSIPAGTEADVNRAVGSARRAFEAGDWREAPPSVRKKILQRLRELIAQNGPSLHLLGARAKGKPAGEPLYKTR